MWDKVMGRMVERAMPRDVRDSAEAWVLAEAAENGIRLGLRLAAVPALILMVGMATVLYAYFPGARVRLPVVPVVPASRTASEADATPVKPRTAELQLQATLDEVTKERDTLKSTVSELERQVADLNGQVQAAKDLAARKEPPVPSKRLAASAKTSISGAARRAVLCGDGRNARNPADCKPGIPSAEGGEVLRLSVQCGDGRTARDPAECKAEREPATRRSW